MTSTPRSAAWLRVGLVVVVWAIYGRVVGFEFVGLDDPGYVSENPHVLGGLTRASVLWAFTTTAMGNWHPLTWLSLMLDAEIFGPNAAAFHATNVVLHTVNTLLLFEVLLQATGSRWRGALVAALFAAHPLHVESVAWVSERKDVLSTMFWFLATLAYVRYVRDPGVRRYVLVLLALLLGLLCKPMLVTLPLTLLLLDLWPLRRFAARRVGRGGGGLLSNVPLWDKLPMIALALATGIVALWAQSRVGAVATLEYYSLVVRLSNAVVSYGRYLVKALWPAALAVYYPYDLEALAAWRVTLWAAVLIAMTALALRAWRRFPWLTVGWLWYLVTLLPVIGLVQVGMQASADRYTYVPLVGPFVAVAWGISLLAEPLEQRPARRRWLIGAVACVVVGALAVGAGVQVGRWRDSTTLFTHALRVTEHNKTAHDALGLALHRQGRLESAVEHYREALRISPGFVGARTNLAAALAEMGLHDEAIAQHSEVLRLRPDDPEVLANLGISLTRAGRIDEALGRFAEALRLDPESGLALKGRAAVLARQGRMDEAVEQLRRALQIDPLDAEVHFNLGTALMEQGREDEAERHFTEALRLDPDDSSGHKNLGVLLARSGRLREAIVHFAAAVRLDPDDEGARRNLERARAQLEGSTDD